MPLKNVLLGTFLSNCVEQKVCVCTTDLVSADKIHHHWKTQSEKIVREM